MYTSLQDFSMCTCVCVFFSYLSDQRQKVVLNGCSSVSCDAMSGVPQGSVLGPLLFLLYINVLEGIPLSAGTKFVLYADDVLVYKPISSLDDHHLFQGDLNAITTWIAQNSMTLNTAKCKYMLVSRKRSSLTYSLPHSLLAHPQLLWRRSLVSNIWEYT